jgi:hypothetical protein
MYYRCEEAHPGRIPSLTPSAGITRIRFKGYDLRLFTTPVNVNMYF